MENIVIGILITLLAIAIITAYKRYQDKKTNKIEHLIQKNSENEDEDETTKLDIYNAIIDLSNQIQIVNILLFLIFVVLFIKLLLPSILAAIGIGYVANELNNIF